MKSFDYLWQLLAPASVYENKKNMCKELWYSFPLTQQRTMSFPKFSRQFFFVSFLSELTFFLIL